MAQERSAIDDSAGSQCVAIELFLGPRVPRLSQAAPEVLSISGFTQPTTRPQIDHQIRGASIQTALQFARQRAAGSGRLTAGNTVG